MGSLWGIVFGFVLIPLGIILLIWNEGNAVKTAKGLQEGAASIVAVDAAMIDPVRDHKLVHLSGEVSPASELHDEIFGISCKALRLNRNVEIYQWQESKSSKTQKSPGGGSETITTTSYDRKWVNEPVDSSRFKEADTHQNPGTLLVTKSSALAKDATLGAFHLPQSVIVKMTGDEPLPLGEDNLQKLAPELREKAHLSDGKIYFGKDPALPEVGDQKVSFSILKPNIFSVAAAQNGNSVEPYPTRSGPRILLVESGSVSPALMFQQAESRNAVMTWVLRFIGMSLVFLGVNALFAPLVALADVIPFLGSLASGGAMVVSLLLSMAITLMTISVAWFAFRPLLGIALTGVAVAIVVLKLRMKNPAR